MPSSAIPAQQLHDAVERVVRSRTFGRAERAKAFLRFVVGQAAQGNGDQVKEYVIAAEVFGRTSYDPKVDSVVRVEAGKLRRLLVAYYADEGRDDPIRIELPKGRYVPVFVAQAVGEAPPSATGMAAGPVIAATDGLATCPDGTPDQSVVDVSPRRDRPMADSADAAGGAARHVLGPVLALGLVVIGLLSATWLTPEGGKAPSVTRQPSLALLPVVDMGSPPAAPEVVTALSTRLLSTVDALGVLRVTAWHSVSGFERNRRDRVDVRDAGVALGVHAVLESLLQLTPDRLQLSVALVDTRDGVRIWNATFEEPASDISAAIERVARRVARHLAALSGVQRTLTRPHSPDPVAYQHYLRAQVLLRTDVQDLGGAVELLRAATVADPRYGLAWAALSSTLSQRVHWGFARQPESVAEAQAAARRALALDATLVEAHQALGRVHALLRNDPWAAEPVYERALALDPAAVEVREDYAWFILARTGRLHEARTHLERCLAFDSRQQSTRIHLAQVLASLGDLERAEELLRLLEQEAPGAPGILVRIGNVRALRGRFDEAVEFYERAAATVRSQWVLGYLGWGWARAGQDGAARGVVEELSRHGFADPLVGQAAILLALGDTALALDLLERAEREQAADLFGIHADIRFRELHGDTRFRKLISRTHGPEVLRGM